MRKIGDPRKKESFTTGRSIIFPPKVAKRPPSKEPMVEKPIRKGEDFKLQAPPSPQNFALQGNERILKCSFTTIPLGFNPP